MTDHEKHMQHLRDTDPKNTDLKVGATYKFIFRLSIIEKSCTAHGMYLLQANEVQDN